MIRWLVNVLSFVSLLLLAAVLTLWVRGYWATDHFWLVYRDPGAELVRSSRGRISVRHVVPNIRGLPVPRRLSHWSVAPGSQLAPAPSPLHWEGAFLVYEGTPAPTRQEIAGAKVALREVQEERSGAVRTGDVRGPSTSPAQSTQPVDAGERAYLAQLRSFQMMDRLRIKEEAAQQALDGTHYHQWTFPAWLAASGLAVLPAARFLIPRHRQRLRRQRGQCPACGYDVRASKDRCPECGGALARGDGSAAAPAGAAAGPGSPSPATSPR